MPEQDNSRILPENINAPDIPESPRYFDFVPFPCTINTNYLKDQSKRYRDKETNAIFYSGIIEMEIRTVDKLYLGSGFVDFDSDAGLSSSTLIENG